MWLMVPMPSARAAEAPTEAPTLIEQPDENNLRLLTVRVGPHIFADLVDGYAYNNITLIPLGALSNMVDLAITVEAENGIARGFLYDEKRTFFLDVPRNQLVLAGKRIPIDRQQVKVYPADIYIDANLLSKWLPFRLDVDLFAALMTLHSDTKLPFEEKLDRQRRFEAVKARQDSMKTQGYPEFFEPYAHWTMPFLTATVQGNASYNDTTNQSSTNVNYAVHGTGDLLKMEGAFYVSGNNQRAFDQLRLTMGRKDPNARLLGPLLATEYAFGHINSPSSHLISTPITPQVGALVSKMPLNQQGEFDRHDFRGELPAGWEVELYHNNALVGYQTEGINGQYQFPGVPLFFGRNHFRLVFYGPQGQKREETHNFELDRSLINKGTHHYRVQTSVDPDGGLHSGARYDYGITDRLSINTEYQGLTLGSDKLLSAPAEERHYGRLGLRSLLGGMFLSTDYVADNTGGNILELGLNARFGADTTIGLKGNQLNNYVSDAFPMSIDPIKTRAEVTLNTAIPPVLLARIPVGFTVKSDTLVSGATRNQFDNRLSLTYSRFAVSNLLSKITATGSQDLLTGQLGMSLHARRFNLRSNIGYALEPTSEVTSIAVTADNIRYRDNLFSFGITQLLTSSNTQLAFNYTRPVGKLAFNVGLRYDTLGITTLNFGLTMGVAREPRTPFWVASAKPVAGTGAVSARVFLDRDQDGVFGPGDELLPGVALNRNGNRLPTRTNKNGVAFLTNLGTHYPANLTIATESLDDPLWKPSVAGVRLSLRPGSVARIDFPILETGEIDGTAYLFANKRLRGVGDVELELINEQGRIVQTTKSAYDGFYLFSGVANGKYQIRVAPTQVRELGLFDVRPLEVRIGPNRQFVSGMNFRLERARR